MYDLAIIGGGPGGYTAALRASQLGMKVALIEKRRVGGVCLNEGCIPTKALFSSAHLIYNIKKGERFGIKIKSHEIDWPRVKQFIMESVEKLVGGVEYLLKKSGVEVIKGIGNIDREGNLIVDGIRIEAKWKIIATGSKPIELPFLPFGGRILHSTDIFFVEKIPESLLIIGSGAIGLEIATAFSLLGSKVTLVEAMPTPMNGMDRDIASYLLRALKTMGIEIKNSTRVENAEVGTSSVKLHLSNGETIEGEYILVSIGRKGNSEPFNKVIKTNGRGFIEINDRRETNLKNVFAIGDVVGPPLLAHKASHEGIFLVESLAGLDTKPPRIIPYAVFTIPEYGAVGISEEEAKKQGINLKKGKFPMMANGRALSLDEKNGMVKVISDERNKILGVQILGPNASEMISEAALAMEKGGRAEDIANTVHVHPTTSESLMEASMGLLGKAIHILNR